MFDENLTISVFSKLADTLEAHHIIPLGSVKKVNESKGYSILEIVVEEGRNHLIKNMVNAIGSEVYKLNRVSFARINTEGLEEGQYRELTKEELEMLK